MSRLSRSELANLAVGLPIVTAIIGVFVGLGFGFGLGWAVKPARLADAGGQPLDGFSADQIQFKCGQIRGEELKTANERISALVRERDEYEKRVLALEAEVEAQRSQPSPSGRGSGSPIAAAAELQERVVGLERELNAARDQLGDVTRQLFQAEEEKRQLQEALVATSGKLRETEQALVVQTSETMAAKDDAAAQKWWRFLSDSQLEICEKGNRKKMGACREVVQELLKSGSVRERFAHCVRSQQATPAVRLGDKDAELPRFAVYMNQDDRVVRDWYIQMCDPTLPEARGATGLGPAPTSAFGLEDLDL